MTYNAQRTGDAQHGCGVHHDDSQQGNFQQGEVQTLTGVQRAAPPLRAQPAQHFFFTRTTPCPYLAGREERKVYTPLNGPQAPLMHEFLSQNGFRRTQTLAYKPACVSCQACVSTRVVVEDFEWSRSFLRVVKRNADIEVRVCGAETTSAQYALFRSYVDQRHGDSAMGEMSLGDYMDMVEETTVNTRVLEYRVGGQLVACALTDVMSDGLSMIYSFYDPAEADRSLGTFMILDHIRRARDSGLPYVYLGYWVKHSPKMHYKLRFQPQEHLGDTGWQVSFINPR